MFRCHVLVLAVTKVTRNLIPASSWYPFRKPAMEAAGFSKISVIACVTIRCCYPGEN